MSPADDRRIDPAVVAELYAKHSRELRAFLLGVLRDGHLASDAVQAAFAKTTELGHTVKPDSLKPWLFRVAWNEALLIRRRQGIHEKVAEKLVRPPDAPGPDEGVCRRETIEAVRAALDELPAEQRQVVTMRMYEQKKFSTIAQELGLPLGTVLTRMQLALRKLRGKLESDQ